MSLSSTPSIVPTGIMFVIHPSIDFKANEVTLSIKPIVSHVVKVEPDPAVSILGGNSYTGMPVVKEKTIETVVRIRSHKVAILGGLTSGEMSPGVFGLNNGRLVAQTGSKEKRELVMVVTANILPPEKRKLHKLSSIAINKYEDDIITRKE
jgi:hypothetical protein